jgi:hypothetical protein
MDYVMRLVGWIVGAVFAIIALTVLWWMLTHGQTVGAAIGTVLGGVVSLGTNIGHAITSAFS